MTTSHSSGRRHRGRRGRRSGNRGAAQQPNQEQVTQGEVPAEGSTVLPELADEQASVRQEHVEVTAVSVSHPHPHPLPDTRPPLRPMRRRPQPRQPVGPMPMEVLKRGLVLREPEIALQLRPIAGMVNSTASNFGCPMLNRNKTPLPVTGYQQPARCSLGWSIHDQDEAMLCMHTAEMIDCWKAHPEKVEGLLAHIQEEQDEASAAD